MKIITQTVFRKILTIIIAVVLVFHLSHLCLLSFKWRVGRNPACLDIVLLYLDRQHDPELQVNDVILSETINSNKRQRIA